jgi:hypothetical protein
MCFDLRCHLDLFNFASLERYVGQKCRLKVF